MKIKVFNYAIVKFSIYIVEEKLNQVSRKVKCVTKVNLAFRYTLKNIKDGRFRYFYAHANNTLLDRLNFVCTEDDSTKLKVILNDTDVSKSISKEKLNTNRRFFKLTIITVYASLLKDMPLDSKDGVLPKLVLKNRTVHRTTFEELTRQLYNDNFCRFSAFALHLHENHKLEGDVH